MMAPDYTPVILGMIAPVILLGLACFLAGLAVGLPSRKSARRELGSLTESEPTNEELTNTPVLDDAVTGSVEIVVAEVPAPERLVDLLEERAAFVETITELEHAVAVKESAKARAFTQLRAERARVRAVFQDVLLRPRRTSREKLAQETVLAGDREVPLVPAPIARTWEEQP